MRLAIITPEGEIFEVTDDLEAYDLTNDFARTDLLEDIVYMVESVNRLSA